MRAIGRRSAFRTDTDKVAILLMKLLNIFAAPDGLSRLIECVEAREPRIERAGKGSKSVKESPVDKDADREAHVVGGGDEQGTTEARKETETSNLRIGDAE